MKWVTGPFLFLTLIAAAAGLALYIPKYGIHPLEPIYCAASAYVIAWVVSSGYHRYFAHRAFACHPWLKIFYLIVGSAALQQSVLVWASDHRMHHRFVDTDRDPYNIRRSFWWAHIGWMLEDDPDSRGNLRENCPDLARDPWILWQHRYWIWISLPIVIGIPLALGFLIDRPVGMFLWGALLRVVITHQTTFTVNSIAHYFGTQPYSDESSARDVWWLIPFLCGENYHNYHHAFPGDYRNGIRWYHWDPSKWALWLLSHTPLIWGLQRAPSNWVWKARMEMDLKKVSQKLRPTPAEVWTPFYHRLLALRQALEEAAELYAKAWASYEEKKKDWANRSQESLTALKDILHHRKRDLEKLAKNWRELILSKHGFKGIPVPAQGMVR